MKRLIGICSIFMTFAWFLVFPSWMYAASSEAEGPFCSDPVAPGISRSVRMLPKKDPWQPGTPVREILTRRGTDEITPAPGEAESVSVRGMKPPEGLDSTLAQSIRASVILNFEGNSFTGYVPPDPVGEVGPNHYVQMVNTAFSIFDKGGNLLAGPTEIKELWTGQGNDCELYGDGDPIVLYDPLADRWLLAELSLGAVPFAPPWHMSVAVSRTPDPTGEYFLYCFEITDAFPDYPKFGVWRDAYYMSTNDGIPQVGAYAFDRAGMLAGQPATFQKFVVDRNFMLPGDLDGPTPPPVGSPNYFYTFMDDSFWPSMGFPGVDRLEVWEYRVDFDNPGNSAFVQTASLPTEPFDYTVCGFFDLSCVPQPGGGESVDAVSEWPMWRCQYRNFGSYEVLVGNFTVDVDGTNHAGIKWFELRKAGGGTWRIHQEGLHAPDADHRWMGSIAMDGSGAIALGYSVTGETVFPSIRFAYRVAGDPPGTLREEVELITGGGAQLSGFSRWGDYSSMNVDPSDDGTFWYTNEYYAESSSNNWQTRIGAFRVQTFRESAALNEIQPVPTTGAWGGAALFLLFGGVAAQLLRRKK
ncbi:MAG: hypothetical protein HY788_17285 [Deltaproteobacteria bacterium]|nr:hypothetical protein [Deltaproteobacteria bacterium]